MSRSFWYSTHRLGSRPGITVIAATFNGALIGLSIWFENTLTQWPVLKEYFGLVWLRQLNGFEPH